VLGSPPSSGTDVDGKRFSYQARGVTGLSQEGFTFTVQGWRLSNYGSADEIDAQMTAAPVGEESQKVAREQRARGGGEAARDITEGSNAREALTYPSHHGGVRRARKGTGGERRKVTESGAMVSRSGGRR
jgi:hypothetical protein